MCYSIKFRLGFKGLCNIVPAMSLLSFPFSSYAPHSPACSLLPFWCLLPILGFMRSLPPVLGTLLNFLFTKCLLSFMSLLITHLFKESFLPWSLLTSYVLLPLCYYDLSFMLSMCWLCELFRAGTMQLLCSVWSTTCLYVGWCEELACVGPVLCIKRF